VDKVIGLTVVEKNHRIEKMESHITIEE